MLKIKIFPLLAPCSPQRLSLFSKFWEEGDGDCFDIELFTSFDVMSGKDGRLRGR